MLFSFSHNCQGDTINILVIAQPHLPCNLEPYFPIQVVSIRWYLSEVQMGHKVHLSFF